MHPYRTHNCSEISPALVGSRLRLAGWVHRVRDHGGLIFVDLRDHFGISQCVATAEGPFFEQVQALTPETVISVVGTVAARSEETINRELPTGEVELVIEEISVLSKAAALPLPVNTDTGYPEATRLKYRYLDLRRPEMHALIVLRSNVWRRVASTSLHGSPGP